MARRLDVGFRKLKKHINTAKDRIPRDAVFLIVYLRYLCAAAGARRQFSSAFTRRSPTRYTSPAPTVTMMSPGWARERSAFSSPSKLG